MTQSIVAYLHEKQPGQIS